MDVREHPQFPEIFEAMRPIVSAYSQPWTGRVFRAAAPKWASSKDLVSGQGSLRSGARFNAPGSFPAIYASTTLELAMAESLSYQRRGGFPPEHALPLVFKAIHVKARRFINLADPHISTMLAVSFEEIMKDQWWLAGTRGEESVSQAFGRAAHACRVDALAAPSAQPADLGLNIVLFGDNLAGNALKVLRGRRRR